MQVFFREPIVPVLPGLKGTWNFQTREISDWGVLRPGSPVQTHELVTFLTQDVSVSQSFSARVATMPAQSIPGRVLKNPQVKASLRPVYLDSGVGSRHLGF